MVLYDQPGVPHKGWTLDTSIDLRIDEGLEYGEYETCEWCGQEQIRFVHILSHSQYDEEIRTGYVCAEKLTEDYVNPRRQEQKLRNRAARRSNFPNRKWKISSNGNHYMKHDGYFVLVYKSKNGKFKAKIDERFGTMEYDTLQEAKLAIFDVVEKMKSK